MAQNDNNRVIGALEDMAAGVTGRIHHVLPESHPKLARGQVWCRTCGATLKVDPAGALRRGWPKCCGFTMTIDAPDERGQP